MDERDGFPTAAGRVTREGGWRIRGHDGTVHVYSNLLHACADAASDPNFGGRPIVSLDSAPNPGYDD